MFTSKEEFEQRDGAQFPGKVFSETLLKPIFYDQKEHLFDAMFMIHKAHTKMLAEQKILTEDEAATILHGVEQVENMDRDTIEYHAEYEDLFFLVESRIGEIIGEDRKSTRLNSSHVAISYAVFCLKKKK